jgi:hypothetical protein
MSPEQREAALAKAAEARKVQAEVKEQLKSGELSFKALLSRSEKDQTVAKMRVLAVVQSLPGQNRNRAKALLEELGIDEGRRVKGIGSKQREALLERVG